MRFIQILPLALLSLNGYAASVSFDASLPQAAFAAAEIQAALPAFGHTNAISVSLDPGLDHWKAYAASATANYHPQFLSKTRTIDWIRLTDDVRHDIDIARSATVTAK